MKPCDASVDIISYTIIASKSISHRTRRPSQHLTTIHEATNSSNDRLERNLRPDHDPPRLQMHAAVLVDLPQEDSFLQRGVRPFDCPAAYPHDQRRGTYTFAPHSSIHPFIGPFHPLGQGKGEDRPTDMVCDQPLPAERSTNSIDRDRDRDRDWPAQRHMQR